MKLTLAHKELIKLLAQVEVERFLAEEAKHNLLHKENRMERKGEKHAQRTKTASPSRS